MCDLTGFIIAVVFIIIMLMLRSEPFVDATNPLSMTSTAGKPAAATAKPADSSVAKPADSSVAKPADSSVGKSYATSPGFLTSLKNTYGNIFAPSAPKPDTLQAKIDAHAKEAKQTKPDTPDQAPTATQPVYIERLAKYSPLFGVWSLGDSSSAFQIDQSAPTMYIFSWVDPATYKTKGDPIYVKSNQYAWQLQVPTVGLVRWASDGTVSIDNTGRYIRFAEAPVRINANMALKMLKRPSYTASDFAKAWIGASGDSLKMKFLGNGSYSVVRTTASGTTETSTISIARENRMFGKMANIGFTVWTMGDDKRSMMIETDNPMMPILRYSFKG